MNISTNRQLPRWKFVLPMYVWKKSQLKQFLNKKGKQFGTQHVIPTVFLLQKTDIYICCINPKSWKDFR